MNISLIGNSCREYFDKPKTNKVLNKIGLVLSESPSNFDNNAKDSDYEAARSLARRLAFSFGANKSDKQVMILPHPRDMFFAEQISVLTGFEIERGTRSLFVEYLAFPSSYLEAIVGRASIKLLCCLPGVEDYGRKCEKNLFLNYLLAKNFSKILGMELLCVG